MYSHLTPFVIINVVICLYKLCVLFKEKYLHEIVEPAHMELAEPSILTAFERCVAQGATNIICHPYFLSHGKHVFEDVPKLVADAASGFPHVTWTLTAPLGSDTDGVLTLINASLGKAAAIK